MGAVTNPIELSSDDFARRFALRPGQLMWLLGAGASVSAGIPSAWDMIWQFKQTLFVTQRKAAPQSVSDLGNPAIRALLDSHNLRKRLANASDNLLEKGA